MTQPKPDPKSAQFALIGKIVEYLNVRGFYVWHQSNSGRFDADHAEERLVELVATLRSMPSVSANQVQKAIRAALAESWRKVPHTTKGVADIIGLHGGRGTFVAIEVKIGNDRLSEDQSKWLARVKDFKGRTVVVSDFAEFQRLFTNKKPAPDVQVVPGESRTQS